MIQPILDGRADAVFGSRFLSSDYRRVLYFWHSLGNGVLTWLNNILCDLNLTDMETCYKAVRADILRQTPLHFRDFAIEPELTIRLAQWGIRLYEVPVSYAGRTYVEGKKIGWRDGLRALWAMFRCRFLDTRFTTHDGYYILVAVRNAGAFNRWMYRQIAPYVGRRVLEAGCGIGNLTELLLDSDRLVASDFDPFYVEMIARRFGHLENFRTVRMDLTQGRGLRAARRRVARHDHLPERARAHRRRRGRARPLLSGAAARAATRSSWCRSTPGSTRRPTRPSATSGATPRPSSPSKLAPRRLRGRPSAGIQPPGHARLVRQRQAARQGAPLARPDEGRSTGSCPLAKLVERIPGWPALSTIAVGRKPA